jgi:GT2 family glycosyltransferase
LTASAPGDDCSPAMLLRAVQRLVRLAPSTTKALWALVPARARRVLSTALYPIAAGARGGGNALEVPANLRPRAYDVVLSGEVPRDGAVAAYLANERAAGRRIVTADDGPLAGLLLEARIVDGVYVADMGDSDERRAEARRFGLRVVDRHELAAGMAPFPRVSVVIVTHSGGPLVATCLRAVLRNTPWPGLEIIVVDNGSDDATRVLLAMFAQRDGIVLLSNAKNRGFAPAANQGLERSSGEIVVLLNDDTAVGPGWLSRLVAHLEADPDLGIVCPVTNEIGNDAKIPIAYDGYAEMEHFAIGRAFEHAGSRRSIETVALFCAAGRRATLARVGFLDERYAVGMFEDDDLSRTLARSGFGRAVAHDSFVHHVGQASFAKLPDSEYLATWEANRKRFEEKWGVRWAPPERAGRE